MKKMKIAVFAIILLAAQGITLEAQDLASLISAQESELIQLDEGLTIAVDQSGKGPKAAVGDYVMVRYEGKLVNGQTFDKSPDKEPLVFQLGRRQVIVGWENSFVEMNAGTHATLYIPSLLAYGKRGVGQAVPPNADLVYEVQLLKIMNQDGYDAYMDAQEEKAKTAYALAQKRQFQKELQQIRTYARDQKLTVKSLDSGLSVYVKKRGKKQLATDGSKLEVSYTGYLLDGTVVDNSEAPFAFTLGTGKVIAGWEEGLRHFGAGGQGKLLIPSSLAYGPRPITEGSVTIPGNSVLVFDVKIVKLTD